MTVAGPGSADRLGEYSVGVSLKERSNASVEVAGELEAKSETGTSTGNSKESVSHKVAGGLGARLKLSREALSQGFEQVWNGDPLKIPGDYEILRLTTADRKLVSFVLSLRNGVADGASALPPTTPPPSGKTR